MPRFNPPHSIVPDKPIGRRVPDSAVITVLVGVGFLVRSAIAWAPLEWLLRHVLADDSFYYLTIARHFVDGKGFSFDTLAETNGFHPLWMTALLPIYAVIEDQVIAIHAAITFSAILDTASIFVLFRLLGEFGATLFARCLTAGIYSLSPALLTHAGPLNGMETSLNVFLMLAYFRQYWRVSSLTHFEKKDALSLGVISGLLLLVRTDNVVIVGFTLLCFPILSVTRSKQDFRVLLQAMVVILLICLPWLAWSFSQFGTIVQVSGVSVAFMTRLEHQLQGWTGVDYVLQFVKNIAITLTFFPVMLSETRLTSAAGLAVTSISLLFLFSAGIGLKFRNQTARVLPFSLVVLGSAILFVLVHTLRGIYLRGWYYVSLFPALLLCLALLIQIILDSWPRKRTRYLILLSVGLLYSISLPTLLCERDGQIDKFMVVQVMNKILPEGSRVASGNAGVYGYFFEKGLVVGIDGLVNNEAHESIRQKNLEDYCRRSGITHVVDPVGALERTAWYWNKGQDSPLKSMDVIYSRPGTRPADDILVARLKN
jgi:hypothetical protein